MGIVLAVTPSEVSVEPGRQAECTVLIRNTAAVVDQFTLRVVGENGNELGEWVELERKIVNLFPDTDQVVTLTFKPPRSSEVRAGEIPFAVHVESREDPEGSAAEEGTVTVAPFSQVAAEFVPRGSRGSFRGRHRLAVDNLGNSPMVVNIGIVDAENLVRFKLKRTILPTEPGTATLVPVVVVPKKWFLKGPAKTHPFQATVSGEDFDPVTADAAMVQEQVLPKWLPTALAALVALAVMGAILWFTVIKPKLNTDLSLGEGGGGSSSSSAPAPGEGGSAAPGQTESPGAGQPGVSPSEGQGASGPATAPSTPGQDGSQPDQTGGTGGSTQPGAAGSTGAASSNGTPAVNTGNGSTAQAAGGGTTSGSNSGQVPGGSTSGGPVNNPAAASSPPAPPKSLSIPTNVPAGQAGSFKTFSYDVPAGSTFLISDYILSNPRGDSGFLEIRRGNEVLVPFGLDNFRSLDQHFGQPVSIPGGTKLVVAVDCHNQGTACTPSVFFSGTMQ